MTKVVEMKGFKERKPEMVWGCAKCDNQHFYLGIGGYLVCDSCDSKQLLPEEWLELAMKRSVAEE